MLDSTGTSTLIGPRGRALVGVKACAFARVGVAAALQVEHYFAKGKRRWMRLHERGGKQNEVPPHSRLKALIKEYLTACRDR